MNLTLLFDGTWNDPQDRTNVFRLCTSLADNAKDRGRQRFFYDPGVGTGRLARHPAVRHCPPRLPGYGPGRTPKPL
ncbi:MAG: DUF2235 domain-containing protein [Desulfobacteraceae bacterium]|nr:DUF2235 domain-containing protein [Desulfobacteraceae bacterium]